MAIQNGTQVLRKYSMVSAVVLCATFGMVESSAGASMEGYHKSLAQGNVDAAAVEALQVMSEFSSNGSSSGSDVMKTAEQLMTGAIATGNARTVKWVAAAILKGAGENNFKAAELGLRVVAEGSRYQPAIAQMTAEARSSMGVPVSASNEMLADLSAATEAEGLSVTEEDRSFLAKLFDINRSSWKASNRLSVGHDSNVYSNDEGESGPVIKDAVNLSLSASSTRSALQVFYKPTITLSPNKDEGDQEIYQDFVGLLSHELSERNMVRLRDTYRLMEDEDPGVNVPLDNSFWKNTTELSFDRTMRNESRLSTTATATIKRYSDSDQAENKDYKLFSLGGSYAKDFSERTFGAANVAYMMQDYDAASYDKGSSILFLSGSMNHKLNQDLTLEGAAGMSMVRPEDDSSDDKVVPYFKGALTYYFSPRTILTSSVSFEYDEDSSDSAAIGSESFKYQVGAKHEFTEKISWNASVGRTEKTYSTEFITGATSEKSTTYSDFKTGLTYQITRTHGVDAGYKYRKTESDTSDYNRHQIDLGWTVKF